VEKGRMWREHLQRKACRAKARQHMFRSELLDPTPGVRTLCSASKPKTSELAQNQRLHQGRSGRTTREGVFIKKISAWGSWLGKEDANQLGPRTDQREAEGGKLAELSSLVMIIIGHDRSGKTDCWGIEGELLFGVG
jgi:hypothetical protein